MERHVILIRQLAEKDLQFFPALKQKQILRFAQNDRLSKFSFQCDELAALVHEPLPVAAVVSLGRCRRRTPLGWQSRHFTK
jgi:hypothetical protein